MSQSLSDLYRRFENLLPRGIVAEVDNGAVPPVVKLRLNGRLTGWLPYPAEIGANFRRWRPLRVGTQVQACCPSGDIAQAAIVQILYTDALAPPSNDGAVDVIEFNDGTLVRYDSGAQALDVVSAGTITARAAGDITATSGGAVTITAASVARIAAQNVQIVASQGGAGAAEMTGSFRLTGDFDITGTITVNGSITASGAIMDGAGNSNHHSH